VRCDDGDDTVDAALTVILIRNDVRYFVLWFSLHSEHPPHLWIVNGDNTVDAVLSTLYDINLVFNVVRKPEDAKGVIRRYQRGNQKIPKGKSEDTKGVIRRYQRGNQKIPKGESEDTKGGIRRYQRGNQKIPKRESEAINQIRTNNTMAKWILTNRQTLFFSLSFIYLL
jgi:hypothetical protein